MVVGAPTFLCTLILTVSNTLGAKPVDLDHKNKEIGTNFAVH